MSSPIGGKDKKSYRDERGGDLSRTLNLKLMRTNLKLTNGDHESVHPMIECIHNFDNKVVFQLKKVLEIKIPLRDKTFQSRGVTK